MENAKSLLDALAMANRALAVLEEQTAGFGSLEIPVSLRLQLEDKRAEVAALEQRLGVAPAARAASSAMQGETSIGTQINIQGDVHSTIASGERSIAIGGNASDNKFNIGDAHPTQLPDVTPKLPAQVDCDPPTLPSALPCCPFVAGPKITDPRLFVGRVDELRRLTTFMEGVQPISVNVVGERRIGKSSLLYHFFQTWEQRVTASHRYVVMYLSLQEADAQTEAGLYAALARRLLSRPVIQERAALVAALNRQPLTRADFAAALRQVHATDLLPVFCLDEFEALFRYPRHFDDGFYDALRALMDDNVVLLMLVSHQPLQVYRRQHKFTSSFFNLGHSLELGEFTESEATDLVRLPASTVRGAPAALSLEEQRLARAWGGRHPCLLQLAAGALCQARQEGHDAAWAKARFQTEARRIPHNGYNLWRRLFWNGPVRLGRLAQKLGLALDELAAWMIGMAILLILLLALTGILTQTQVLELLRGLLGG